jgi:undecaprenyl diphosphate synthase
MQAEVHSHAASQLMASTAALPRHVAIIMDGNGRWAAQRGLPRLEGHRRGVEAVRATVRATIECGIPYLTLYSFSSENWSRPQEEVGELMGLLKFFIRNDLAVLHSNGVRVKIIGTRDGLPADICGLLTEAENLTQANTKLTLIVAFNYGSRNEIVRAVQAIASKVAEGHIDTRLVDEQMIARHLDTKDVPDPDLIIRTSGEQRLSNFLLWQAAYAEFVFLPLYWPDFDKKALEQALREYTQRDRRFGAVAAHAQSGG